MTKLFAYPGGASMEIHQALTRSETIQNILCRHEQVCVSKLHKHVVIVGVAGGDWGSASGNASLAS